MLIKFFPNFFEFYSDPLQTEFRHFTYLHDIKTPRFGEEMYGISGQWYTHKYVMDILKVNFTTLYHFRICAITAKYAEYEISIWISR